MVFNYRLGAAFGGLCLAGLLTLGCGPGEDFSLPDCMSNWCTSEDAPEGYYNTTVHAPESDVFVFFSFADPGEPVSQKRVDKGEWDLGFARTTIIVNGGVSGDGGVEVTLLDEAALDDVTAADVPAEGWFTDTDENDGLAFERESKWYNYNFGRHVVEVRPRVYFVRATSGRVYGLELLSYYSQTGESRFPTFRWTALDEAE